MWKNSCPTTSGVSHGSESPQDVGKKSPVDDENGVQWSIPEGGYAWTMKDRESASFRVGPDAPRTLNRSQAQA
jgi:hypothetical protein